ncbi:hypothetical protein PM082_005407 [Marasmius tenuissimus]|nr:hypothetical protein PM082_005407 [Marasmius tenuissimus]
MTITLKKDDFIVQLCDSCTATFMQRVHHPIPNSFFREHMAYERSQHHAERECLEDDIEFQEFLNATSYPTPLMALDELYLNVVTLDTGNLNQISNLGPSLRLLHIESAYEDIADTVLCPSNNFTWRFANMEYLAIFGLTSSTFGGSTITDNSLTTLFYEWQRNEGVNLKQLQFDSWFIWNWSIGVGWECLQDRVCTMEERVYHTD